MWRPLVFALGILALAGAPKKVVDAGEQRRYELAVEEATRQICPPGYRLDRGPLICPPPRDVGVTCAALPGDSGCYRLQIPR